MLKRKLMLAASSVILGLVFGETVCRLYFPPSPSLRFQQDVNELTGMGLHGLAGVIENDTDLFWKFGPSQNLPAGTGPFFGVISNAQGLREDHEISFSKAKDEFRILFLGDSCTFGFGLDYKQGFVDVTEAGLQKEFPNQNIECINAGVPGYSLFQGARFLRKEGFRYRPDLVVVCFGTNDMAAWDNRSDFEHDAIAQASRPVKWLQWSRLMQMTWSVFMKSDESSSAKRPRLLPKEYRSLLEEVQEATHDNTTELLVLGWGFRSQIGEFRDQRTPWQKELYEFADDRSVTMIDLIPVFQQLAEEHQPDEIYLDPGHATALANRSIANVIVKRLADWLHRRKIDPQAPLQ